MNKLCIKVMLAALAFIAPASAHRYYQPVYEPVVYREVPVVCERELVREVPVVRERVYVEEPVIVRPVRYRSCRRPYAYVNMGGYRGGFGFSFGF
jgi:hypothetical protein